MSVPKAEFLREDVVRHQGGRGQLRRVFYRFEDGAEQGYDLFDLRANGQMSAGVLPLDDEGYVYLVEEFVAALGGWGLSLPRGGIEQGETPQAAAARELKEEAGLACDVLEPLWHGHPMPSASTWQVHLFVGRGVREIGRAGGDEAGCVRTVKVKLEDLRAKVRAGEVPSALVALAAMMVDA